MNNIGKKVGKAILSNLSGCKFINLTDEEAYELFHAVSFTIEKTENSFYMKSVSKSAGAEAVAKRGNHTIVILKSLADKLQKEFKHLHL